MPRAPFAMNRRSGSRGVHRAIAWAEQKRAVPSVCYSEALLMVQAIALNANFSTLAHRASEKMGK